MKQKVIRVGRHSHAVIVPAEFIHALGIKKGDMVRVKTNRVTGRVTLQFIGAIQLALPSTVMKRKSSAAPRRKIKS